MPIINPRGYQVVLPMTLPIRTLTFEDLQGVPEPERKEVPPSHNGSLPLLEDVLTDRLKGELRGDLPALKRLWSNELLQASERILKTINTNTLVYEPPFRSPTPSHTVLLETCARICVSLLTNNVIHLGYLDEKRLFDILQTFFMTRTLADGDFNDFLALLTETLTEVAIVGDDTFIPSLTGIDDEKYRYSDLDTLKAAKSLETQCCTIDCTTIPTIKAGLGRLLRILRGPFYKEKDEENEEDDDLDRPLDAFQWKKRSRIYHFLPPPSGFNELLLDELYSLRNTACDGLAQYLALHGIPLTSIVDEKDGRYETHPQHIFEVVKEVIPSRYLSACLALRRSRRLPERTFILFSCTPDTPDMSPIIEALAIIPQVRMIISITGMVRPEWLTEDLQVRLQIREIITLDIGYRSSQLTRTLDQIDKKSMELTDYEIHQMRVGVSTNTNTVVEQVSSILKHLSPQDRTRRIMQTLIELQLSMVSPNDNDDDYPPFVPIQSLLKDLSDVRKHKTILLQKGERLERVLAGYITKQTTTQRTDTKKGSGTTGPIQLAPCRGGLPGIGLRGTRDELEELLTLFELDKQPSRGG